MTAIKTFWLLLLDAIFGFRLREPDEAPEPKPEPPAMDDPDWFPEDDTEPLPTEAPVAPNIIVPDPAHADDWGPASSIARALRAKGFELFEKDHQNFNLNHVLIRNSNPVFDRFNCRRVHFWRFQGEVFMEEWPITTYPGEHYTVNRLLNPAGVAILAEGQHRGKFEMDYHRGSYMALCQVDSESLPVYRDGNRNRIYDLDRRTIQHGSFGINHHATENPDDGISRDWRDRISSASAGCLVNARVQDFVDGREQWKKARMLWGQRQTVTLIRDTDLDDAGTVTMEAVEPQIHESAETWRPEGTSTGIRNRNLMNVKNGSDPWKYGIGTDSRGHVIFPSYAKGLRAAIIDLRSKFVRRGLKTLMDIMKRYAPDDDTVGSIAGNPQNDPAAYARFVAQRAGVTATEKLTIFREDGSIWNRRQLKTVVEAMVRYENGFDIPIPDSVFDEAISLM